MVETASISAVTPAIDFHVLDIDPRAAEKRNVLVASCRRPWWLIAHGWALFWFTLQYTANRVRRRLVRDVHKNGKRRPAWIGARAPEASADRVGGLMFPEYPARDLADARLSSASVGFERDRHDIESLFAQHRWLECQRALAESDETVEGVVSRCVEWLRRPPPRSAPAWEPYSTSERVANLIVLLAARPAGRRAITDDTLRDFLQDSINWIDAHLEYYGPRRTNNHLLNNARALVIGGAVLGDTSAVETGLAISRRMARDLFQPGGFLRERSAHYQLVVTNWLLDTLHFARLTGPSNPAMRQDAQALAELAHRVSEATSRLWRPLKTGGSYPGDISPDSAPLVSVARLDRLYPKWTQPPGATGANLIDDWLFLSDADQSVVACVIDGAFPLAYPTHGHSDVGHFIWHWRDACVLADAGRWRYTKDACSLAQADARGHNVVLIDGLGPLAESLVRGGLWHLRPYSNASVHTHLAGPAEFAVEHGGFARLGSIGVHSRTVRLVAGGIKVADRIDGTGAVTIDMLWHFSPTFSPRDGKTIALSDGHVAVECVSVASVGGPADARWHVYGHSSEYGDLKPAPLLRLRWTLSLPCSIETTLQVSPCAA